MFKLIPETWTVLKHAWSVRFIVLSIVVVWLEGPLTTLVQYVAGGSLRSQLIAQGLVSTLMLLALYARVVVQNRMTERVKNADQ